MGSRSDNYFYRDREMGRSIYETMATLPGRCASALRVEDMDEEEKDFAHLSKEVYKKPDERQTELRGHILLKGNIPVGRKSVPLNDKRWAVYRAPKGLDPVLVFRGTKDNEDVDADLDLGLDCTEHKYMLEAAVWSSQVMLFLDGEGLLKFRVAGHSLGSAVAISVVLLLHDIPATVNHIADSAKAKQLPPHLPNFKQKVADPWYDAISKTGIDRLFELRGGHVFNPGAWFRSISPLRALVVTGAATGPPAGATGAFLGVCLSLIYHSIQTHGGTNSRPDNRVTTHHIIGDLISCFYRMGGEKSYMAKRKRAFLMALWPFKDFKSWGPHSIENFL